MSTSRAPASVPSAGVANPKINALPSDEGGCARWDLQHEAYSRAAGGLYSASVPADEALKPREGSVPRILDAGTASGIWAADMAKKFPHCEVVGIDIVLPPPIESQPPNLRFEVVDVNLPLPMETASVDFVFARMMENVIVDYPHWLSEVSRILRPNGVYCVAAGHLSMADKDGTELPTFPVGEPGYSGLQSMMSALRTTSLRRWGGVYSIDRWGSWMAENGNFDKIGEREVTLLPFGALPEGADENTRIVSEAVTRQLRLFVPALVPTLLDAGYEETVVSRWAQDATAELTEQRTTGFHVWSSMWCVRSSNEWVHP